MNYHIGDKVWFANRKVVQKRELCPDCFGELALTVIKGDGSKVSIECAGCASGFEPPKGYVTYYAHEVAVTEVIIDKIELTSTSVEYYFHEQFSPDHNYYTRHGDIFDTKEEAEKRAEELAKQHNQEELDQIYRKEKHNRTWSWNAHYHRDCIKRAEKNLAYHTAKLNVAKVKAKEDKQEGI
jgi:hypothetical protein